MKQLKHSDALYAIDKGFNDDRWKYDIIMKKIKNCAKLTKDEKEFMKEKCDEGKLIRNKIAETSFNRHFL